jgi:hypothetical protein
MSDLNYIFNDISNEENHEPEYEEIGMITLFDTQALNILRRNINKLQTIFGLKGVNAYIYNYAINSIMKKINTEMQNKKIDKICNATMKITIPQFNIFKNVLNNQADNVNNVDNINNVDNLGELFNGGSRLNVKLPKIIVFFYGTALRKIK